MSEKEIAWDLSEIYQSTEDPKINSDIKELEEISKNLVNNYKGKITQEDFSPKNLLELLEALEIFYAKLDELSLYANRLYDADMTNPVSETLKKRIEDFSTEMLKSITFVKLEVGKLIYDRKELINDPVLVEYKHYLEQMLREVPHFLSEVEEQVILEKDQFGVHAWSQLQGKWLNTREYEVNVEGTEKKLSYGEANSYIYHPDRDTRISANKGIYGKLGEEKIVFTSALSSICNDWMRISKRRKYETPMHHSLIVNDTTKDIIDNLMNSIETEGTQVYQKYMSLKAKILKLPKLSCADIHAPLPLMSEKKYPWEYSKNLILEAFRRFDPTFAEYAEDMFTRNHIDAEVRNGKRNGAYCDTWYNGKTSYILLSFTQKLKELYTLAHELGHAIHGYLATRENTYLNFHAGSAIAECASIFGELLVTDLLLEKAESKEEKMKILAHVLDDAGQAAFQVSARVWFETSLYESIKNGENLDGSTISKYWCAGRDKIYGDTVDWFEEMDYEWAMKPHYFFPNYRYYNYPYVFAQLFVYTLYQTYKSEGSDFVSKFKKLLSMGGSQSPQDLAKIVGLDLTKPDFWKLGIKQYSDFVDQLESLII